MVGYVLGVDLGTTYTAAAVARDGHAQIFELSSTLAAIPSVVFASEDGTYITGEAANRRGTVEPDRVARQFKRRIGGPNFLLGGAPISAHSLTARLLRSTYDAVAAREAAEPDEVVLTHPANWGEYKIDLLRQAARMCDLTVTTVTEPEAAAIAYAANERVAVGDTMTVYDLGGGTFDAAVLRKTDTGFEILGQPEGLEQLGGMDFDEAVYNYTLRSLPDGALDALDFDDDEANSALERLRNDCVAAKEALSYDTQTTIHVFLPTVQTQVRLTREEFEALIRPLLAETIDALNRAIRSAGLESDAVQRVVLVGGSSRIPLVAQMIAASIGRPVAIDAHPKHAIAAGASLMPLLKGKNDELTVPSWTGVASSTPEASAIASPTAGTPLSVAMAAGATAATSPPPTTDPTPAPPPPPTQQVPPPPPPPAPAPPGAASPPPSKGSRRGVLIGAIAAGVVVAALAAVFLLGGSNKKEPAAASQTKSTTTNSSASTTSVTPPTQSPTQELAAEIDSTLQPGANARAEVVQAVNGVDSCQTDPNDAITSLQDAINTRQSMLTGVQSVQWNLVQQGNEVRDDVTQALNASVSADQSFIQWANFVEATGCNGNAPHDANFDAAQSASTDATNAKDAFLQLWNPIAAQVGTKQYVETDL